ncbi:MAG TPA: SHOCT domain-containing protein [Fimbriimonadaceae bacterium]|jgi:hypothetical protein
MECLLFAAVVIAAAIALGISQANAKEKARIAYDNALTQLRQHPTDPAKRIAALSRGRIYSNLSRNQKGVALYDEVAIQNDIGAATAGAVHQVPQTPAPSPAVPSVSPADRLEKLDDLRTRGLISEDEYQNQRARILADL